MPRSRLTAIKPAISAPRARAVRPPDAREPQHNWYRSARWRALRLRVFKRDGYRCQKTGELLTGKHPAPNSPVADHDIDHNWDPVLFWDENNVQTVAKWWHDGPKQRLERAKRDAGGAGQIA